MTPLPRAAVGLAGLAAAGAGLVALAVGADHLRRPGGAGTGVGLAVVGLVWAAWGLAALRAGRVQAPRAAVGAGLALPAVWTTAVAQGLVAHGTPSAYTAADVALVTLSLTAALAVAVERRRTAGPATRTSRPGRSAAGPLLRWGAAAVLVAAITTPGLAATDAGAHAVPHHGHSGPVDAPPPPAESPRPAEPHSTGHHGH